MTALLIDVRSAAERLGLSTYQVRAEHARGLLPGRRSGRLLKFAQDDLDTYLLRIKEDRGSDASGLTPRSRGRRRKP